jgi:hypothetical protein
MNRGKPCASVRRQLGDLRHHALEVRRRVQLPARAEGDAVLRVELRHRHFLEKVASDFLKNLLQDLRVEEKGGTKIEAIAIALDNRSAPAHARLLFQNGDFRARFGEQHG